MSTRLAPLASEKELLLMRSALCRLRLRRGMYDLGDSLHWKRAAIAVATAPAMRRLVFGIAVSLAGLGRTARVLMLAGRVILFAKLAGSLIDYARKPARPSV